MKLLLSEINCKFLKKFVVFVFFILFLFLFFKIIIPIYDERIFINGDALHNGFGVAVFDNEKYIGNIGIKNIKHETSIIPKSNSGKMHDGLTNHSYKIIKRNENEYVVETESKDEDGRTISTYKINKGEIIPIKSRSSNAGYLFLSIILSMIATILFSLIFNKIYCSDEKKISRTKLP